MSRDSQWLSQVTERAGAGVIRWNLHQLRTHLHVVWSMTYPRRAPTEQGLPVPGAPTSTRDSPPPPPEGVAPPRHDGRSPRGDNVRERSNIDHGRVQGPGSEDPTVAECLPIFLCSLDIIRQLIDKLPWKQGSGLRNIPEESKEFFEFLQIVQEISECDNSIISAVIDTQFTRSIEHAFKKMTQKQDWHNMTSTLLDLIDCRSILIKLTARHSITSGV